MEIRIVQDEHGTLDVWMGDRHTQSLTIGEAIEQMVGLFHPQIKSFERYPMETDATWEARALAMQMRRITAGEPK